MMNRQEARRLAHDLVAQMTLEEKASQLRYDAPAIPRLNVPAYNWWNEALHGVARAGTATVFPQAIGLAAVFDEDFHEEIAQVISTETRAKFNAHSRREDRDQYKGLTMWSPNINIFRDPRWGRGHETYGEDPYLTSRLGVRFIRGLQGDGRYLKAAACAKHFAVHSGPESLRHGFDAVASPKDMYETYLPAFEAAVTEAHVESVMGAYNRVDGEPACGSKKLLVDILREKWAFEGHVVSDCGAIADFHNHHHVTDTAPESAALALKMGCDINCGQTYLHILQAYQEGLVTEEDITRSCERAFTTRYLLGLFAEDCEYDAIPYTANDTDEHNALALAAAEKSMVLLKNDGILPLNPEKVRTIGVVGPNANSILALEANYNGTSSRYVTFLEGIRAYAEQHGIRVMYSQGCHLFEPRLHTLTQPDDCRAEVEAIAECADVIIACVGLDRSMEGEAGEAGEGGDRKTLGLPEPQQRLMENLQKTGKPLVTVVAAGSAMNVPQGNALLQAWYPGQAGGTALANILFGKVSPSGKLPLTFYNSVEELPDFTDYAMANRTYRYFTGKPLYPFGFGLSYTTFEVNEFTVDAANGWVTASVANTGNRAGETVVQVYARAVQNPCEVLNTRLIGFARVTLQPGEKKNIAVQLDKNAFTLVNEAGERISITGPCDIWCGLSQPDDRSIELMGKAPLKTTIVLA